jgi:pimeloyl-ACP methyl ester carboxylesterase
MPALIRPPHRFHYLDSGAPITDSPPAAAAAQGAPAVSAVSIATPKCAPVVALHSGGLSSRQWLKLSALLAPRHRILAPDFLGCGGSSAWPEGTPYRFSVETSLVVELISTLDEPVHLVGHSFGGLVALHAALEVPARVRSLTLFEPVAFALLAEQQDPQAAALLREMGALVTADVEPGSAAWLRRFVDWWQGAGTWESLPQQAKAQFLATGPKVALEVASLLLDQTGSAQLSHLPTPTLVLRSEASPLAERRTCELLAAVLPRGRLEQVDGTGHLAPVTHAAQVNARIAAHIDAS